MAGGQGEAGFARDGVRGAQKGRGGEGARCGEGGRSDGRRVWGGCGLGRSGGTSAAARQAVTCLLPACRLLPACYTTATWLAPPQLLAERRVGRERADQRGHESIEAGSRLLRQRHVEGPARHVDVAAVTSGREAAGGTRILADVLRTTPAVVQRGRSELAPTPGNGRETPWCAFGAGRRLRIEAGLS